MFELLFIIGMCCFLLPLGVIIFLAALAVVADWLLGIVVKRRGR